MTPMNRESKSKLSFVGKLYDALTSHYTKASRSKDKETKSKR